MSNPVYKNKNHRVSLFPWILKGGGGVFLVSLSHLALAASESTSEMATVASSSLGNTAIFAISAGFTIGVAAFGGAIGQGKLGASAMEGIARNPQAQKDMFIPLMVGMAFIESLVIYALLIAFLLQGKI